MNIFVLDNDQSKCAKYHCNKHVVKMILESAQLLCSAHWMTGNEAPYRKTHVNHPCAVWTRESADNYLWLCKLGKELCSEYSHRYGKRHKTEDVIDWLIEHKPELPNDGLTKFAMAMPEQYQSDSIVESYRNYYLGEKADMLQYKNRDIPEWLDGVATYTE